VLHSLCVGRWRAEPPKQKKTRLAAAATEKKKKRKTIHLNPQTKGQGLDAPSL
jgi:hypothetical protein